MVLLLLLIPTVAGVSSTTLLISTTSRNPLILMSNTGCHIFPLGSEEAHRLRQSMKGSLVHLEEAGYLKMLDICDLLRSMSNIFMNQGSLRRVPALIILLKFHYWIFCSHHVTFRLEIPFNLCILGPFGVGPVTSPTALISWVTLHDLIGMTHTYTYTHFT